MSNIGLDISALAYDRGVSRYTANLVRSLIRYTPHQIWLYGSSFGQYQNLVQKARSLLGHDASTSIQHYPVKLLSWLWRLGLNPVKNALPQIEVFHSWDYLQPPDLDLPLVSTVHDLAMLKFPQSAHPDVLSAHKRAWQVLQQRNCQIIAVSQATKRDIVELLGIPQYRIHVVPEALPEEMRQVTNTMTDTEFDQITAQLQLTKPFILSVGVREPRKNLKRLIQAWQPLADEYDLLVAGAEGWHDDQKIPGPQPKFLGHVDTKTLSVLYSQAVLFAYPSLYEGFGLPILEAFHHATPVLTTNNSGMLEVAGNAAELVDPESVEDIRRGLGLLLSENDADRAKRTQRMIIRLQLFSWERTARETAMVYQKAIEDFK